MTFRIALLLALAAAVGAAVVYVVVRQPARPAVAAKVPCPPDAHGCEPGTRVDPPAKPVATPHSSENF